MNGAWLIGNLCADPDLQQTQAGTPVCNIRLADNRSFKDKNGIMQKETTYVDCVIWGSRGESFARFHKKGDLASVSGRLRSEDWIDKATGGKRTTLKIVAEEWKFVGERKTPGAPEPGPGETPF